MAPAPRRRYAPRLPAAQRREQALDAALKLINDHGYGGVTMEAVAREMGITKPVVYDAFPNRGELLRALLEREEQRAFAALSTVLPAVPDFADPGATLVEGLEAFLTEVRDGPRSWRLILLPVDGTPEVVRCHVEQGRRHIREALEELVSWGLERRGGPAWAEPELLAHAILALGEHGARLVLTDPERFPPRRLAVFLGSLLAGVGHDAPGTRSPAGT